MIYNYLSPDTKVKTAGHVATSARNILNRASTLVNFGYGEEKQLQGKYMNKETGILNKEGRRYFKKTIWK